MAFLFLLFLFLQLFGQFQSPFQVVTAHTRQVVQSPSQVKFITGTLLNLLQEQVPAVRVPLHVELSSEVDQVGLNSIQMALEVFQFVVACYVEYIYFKWIFENKLLTQCKLTLFDARQPASRNEKVKGYISIMIISSYDLFFVAVFLNCVYDLNVKLYICLKAVI